MMQKNNVMNNPETAAASKRDGFAMIWVMALALFLVRTLSWAMSELWYDEVLSLEYFVFAPESPLAIFRDYRIANNHFLSNALEWLWVRIPGCGGDEYLLRIPSLAAGLGTIAIILKFWRRRLGDNVTAAVAVMMALSPVFAAFAWQMRGYSLAMFLVTATVTLAEAYREKPDAAKKILLFITSLLLPLTMPSAAMAPLAIAAGSAAHTIISRKEGFRKACRNAMPLAVGAILGVLYYTTLWKQFNAARVESGGWESGWAVLGCVVGSFVLHLGVFSASPLAALWRRFRGVAGEALPESSKRALWQLSGAILALVAVLLLPSPTGRSPFPRVFLVLLPIVTLSCGVIAVDSMPFLKRWALPRVLLLVAAPALALGFFCDWEIDRRLDLPQAPPQNLLTQYYRGAGDARNLVYRLSTGTDSELAALPADRIIIADPYISPTLMFYWQSSGMSMTLDGILEIPAVYPGNMVSRELAALCNGLEKVEMFFFVRNSEDAAGLMKKMNMYISMKNFTRVYTGEHWHLYRYKGFILNGGD
jgi:uncharacterized membrane protein